MGGWGNGVLTMFIEFALKDNDGMKISSSNPSKSGCQSSQMKPSRILYVLSDLVYVWSCIGADVSNISR
jgi:hypothetical protein